MTAAIIFLCIKVCFARILDVSLGTTRTVLSVKGKTFVATLIGFFEALIWFLVVREALTFSNATAIEIYLIAGSYALGFAAGTFIGGKLATWLIASKVKVEIITSGKDDNFVSALNLAGYGATVLVAKGATSKDERYMIFVETTSKKIKHLRKIIDEHDNKAFVTVNESRAVFRGYFSK